MRCTFPATTLALALCLTAAPAGAQSAARHGGLDHAGLARHFLASHDLADANPATVDLRELLAERYLHVRLGLFELYTPASGRERDLEDFQRLARAILLLQEGWMEWLAPAAGRLRDVEDDQRALAKWIDSWKPSRLAEIAAEGGGDLLLALEPRESVGEAARRYADWMIAGSALGLAREDGAPEPLVLMPERGPFVEFLCFGGWLYEHLQPVFWQGGVEDWTHFYIDEFKVLATSFAAPGRPPGDYQSGVRMDARTPTGLEQQIVQLAANSMFANYFGDRVPPSLAGAMAVNLVIDLYGECNTRVDGDLRARRTAAREIFVPGGNPDGGILPPNLADSRWRSTHGADRFVSALKAAMEKRKRRNDPVRFELMDDAERERIAVPAPFLGSAARLEPLPDDFYGDRLEFLRAYRTCFVHWLREEAAGSAKRSSLAYARLLQELARNGDPERIEPIFAEVFGSALSAPELGKDELEGQFLAWLAKQR